MMLRALVASIALLTFASGASAQMRPNSKWQQIESEHFRVIYEAGLDSMAQHAARRAEVAYKRLSEELSRPPRGKIDIMLGDNLDLTNGAAAPFPSNRIYLWAKPPADDPGLGYHNDWMDLVIVHELTHIFHLDRTGTIGRAIRTVFGRFPWAWPVFPTIGTPGWTLEGLATYRESKHTGAGRVYGSYHEMIIRTAILEGNFDPIDRVNAETPIWPGGAREYIYGSLFMDYIAERFGEEAHRQFLNKIAGSILPPPWVLNSIARRSFGQSFSKTYDEWRQHLRQRYATLSDSIRAGGLTKGEHVAGGGRYVFYPRISPDGGKLAYVEDDGRNPSSIIVLDLATRERERARRNALAPISWANNHVIYTTQPEFTDPYSVYSDIYVQTGGSERRVTRGGRYDNADIDKTGRKLIAVKQGGGTSSLVQIDAATGSERVVVAPQPGLQWVSARWSPDGTRIAADAWKLGGTYELVIMDTLGTSQMTTSIDRVVITRPTWSPDGRYVLYSMDRDNIPNLYAWELQRNDVRQITNTVTGVFYPDVSPDGRWIYYTAYHSNGFAIERIPFDPASWRSVTPTETRMRPVQIPQQSGHALPVRNYNALRSALPKFWAPFIAGDSAQGTFLGVATFGYDDVGRHEYDVALGHNFENGRTTGYLGYNFSGLGNPVLSFGASREYATLLGESIEREDNLSLRATFVTQRWRSRFAFSVGGEAAVFRRDSTQRVRDTEDRLVGVTTGVSFRNYRMPAYAISAEDGIRAGLSARRRFDIDPVFNDDSYSEINGSTAAYKSISAFGFAHHVVAARASFTIFEGPRLTDVGGISNFLPVRGFDETDRFGRRGWSASLEYRFPIAMIGRGAGMLPLFIDRTAGSFFLDAGNATGVEEKEMLLSAGAEVGGSVAFLSFIPAWYRVGVAKPLQGPASKWQFYLTFGPSF